MFRRIAISSITLVIGAAALAAASLAVAGPAAAFDGRYERTYERYDDGFRPPPPVFHGYWGHRRWQRHHDGYGYGHGFRAPPPPPPYGYERGFGWR